MGGRGGGRGGGREGRWEGGGREVGGRGGCSAHVMVPAHSPVCSCNGCQQKPIVGSRFHCQVCLDFDFCQKCFEKDQNHSTHAFERIDDPSQPAIFIGTPLSYQRGLPPPMTKARTQRRERKVKGGSIIVEWDQVVARVTASSNQNAVPHLWDKDATTYWQSSGQQGKVRGAM